MQVEMSIYGKENSISLFQAANTPTREKQYLSGDFSFLNDYESLKTNNQVNSTLPNLDPKGSSDAENAMVLYDALGSLSIDYSLDPRFWIHLTHNEYQDYVFNRWIKDNSQKSKGTITDRFFGFYKLNTDRSISRNAIARLWWGAKMTMQDDDPELEYYFNGSDDKYKYTRMLFSGQNVHSQLMERSLSRSKKIVLSILHYADKNNIELTKENIIKMTKTVCLQMYNNRLAMLKSEEIYDCYNTIIDAS